MITFEQALKATRFHEDHSTTPTVGPRGGVTMPKIFEWRRNGKTQTWKTRPGLFRIPVKFGLRSYDYITDSNAWRFHVAEDCPLKESAG